MQKIALIILMVSLWGDIPWQDAISTFNQKNYKKSSELFQHYAQEMPLYAHYLNYNAAMSELLQDSLKQAQWLFNLSSVTNNSDLKSNAYCSLGYIHGKQNKNDEALNYWRLALKENPNNDIARYNYELCLRRKPREDIPPDNKLNPKTSPNKKKNIHQHNQDKGDGDKKDFEIGIIEAENILEALENQEKKFIQQLRKRNKGTKVYDESEW